MRKVFLTVGILGLVAVSCVKQNPSALNSQVNCNESASTFFKTTDWGSGTSSITQIHYNQKLNKCLTLIEHNSPSNESIIMLYDALGQKRYGYFDQLAKNDKPSFCSIDFPAESIGCKSRSEFNSLVNKYLND